MSNERKILIFSKQRSSRITPRSFRIYIKILQSLGYRFTTVTDALQRPAGKFCCLTFDAVDEQVRDLAPYLRSWRIPATVFVAVDEIENPQDQSSRFTWKRARRFQKWKWEIGTYGKSLIDLTTVSHHEQLQYIRDARDIITQRLGHQPSTFAYPHGAYDTSVVKILKDHGFRYAVSSTPGMNDRATHALQLKRLRLSGRIPFDLLGILRWASRKPQVGSGVPLVTASKGQGSTA